MVNKVIWWVPKGHRDHIEAPPGMGHTDGYQISNQAGSGIKNPQLWICGQTTKRTTTLRSNGLTVIALSPKSSGKRGHPESVGPLRQVL